MSDKNAPKIRPRKTAIRLHAGITPPQRTPWGGRRIVDTYKPELKAHGPVGEAWELSVSELPSRLDDGTLLRDAIAQNPSAWLGTDAWPNTPLLVKLLDAAAPLSVQIHPHDDDPKLAADESGKPEAWYIVHAEPGAGLWIGFEDNVDAAAIRNAIEQEQDVSKLLRFVEVQRGDFFVIDPGTPHAIGPGLTLVEPQRVVPGKRGLTYRYWDWNRRYDSAGQPDDNGEARELHLERALEVSDFGRDWGAWLSNAWQRTGEPDAAFGITPLCEQVLGVSRLSGSGRGELDVTQLMGITVVEGSVRIEGADGSVSLGRGRSAVLPASVGEVVLHAQAAEALLTWIPEDSGT